MLGFCYSNLIVHSSTVFFLLGEKDMTVMGQNVLFIHHLAQ